MGFKKSKPYHCHRHHGKDLHTKAKKGELHKWPERCGYKPCKSPYWKTLPVRCFVPGYNPFAPENIGDFQNPDGTICERCVIEWAKEMGYSEEDGKRFYAQNSLDLVVSE